MRPKSVPEKEPATEVVKKITISVFSRPTRFWQRTRAQVLRRSWVGKRRRNRLGQVNFRHSLRCR